MRFITSSETYKNIGHETTKLLDLAIKPKINELIKDKSYGDGVVEWAYLTISLPDGYLPPEFFTEIKRYRKSKKEVEFRLKVDNGKLSKANQKEAYALFCESILRSIDIAESELKIKDFDFAAFRNDLQFLFQSEGWIVNA